MVEARKPKSTLKPNKNSAKPAYPYDFTDRLQRSRAVQTAPNYRRKDPLLDHLLKNMESLFTPKAVCGPSDWLVT